jgi:hypothetical protein
MPTESGRHRLYEKIKEQWGEEHATELMSYLPPVGWADVATKHDLDTQTTLLRLEMARLASDLRAEFERFRADTNESIANLQRTMITMLILMTGIFSTVVAVAAVVS